MDSYCYGNKHITLALLVLLLLSSFSTSFASTTSPFKIRNKCSNVLVWQRFGNWLMCTEDLPEGRVCYYYDYATNSRLNLKKALSGSWVPLGSAIKWLMYVDNYNGHDCLMAHDVDWQIYHVALDSKQNQVGCGMTGNNCVYGEYRDVKVGDHYPVNIYSYNIENGDQKTLCASDSEKSQFAHDEDLIVYRAYYSSDDVRICGQHFYGGDEVTIAGRDGIEPSVCGSLVAWAERDGTAYNIMAKDISTGELRLVASTTADPPCPEVGRGTVFWRDSRHFSTTGIDIYGYNWQSREEFIVSSAAGNEQRLRVCDDMVTWVTGISGFETLWGALIETPLKINDLGISLIADSSVKLKWTAIGTSNNPAISYDLRMRTDGPITEFNWSDSIPINDLPTPGSPGSTESFTLSPMWPGRAYFAMKVYLGNGVSELSNCIAAYISDGASVLNANDGEYVSFAGVVAGKSTSGSLYCREESGAGCARVDPLAGQILSAMGSKIIATGIFQQDQTYIGPVVSAATLSYSNELGVVTATGMSNCALGGFSSRYGGASEGGAFNAWMLVRTWGIVSELEKTSNGCFFVMSDGSSGLVRVTSAYLPPISLEDGCYTAIDGIIKITRDGQREIEIVNPSAIMILRK